MMVGYPGSGKTTTSRIIRDLTHGVHLWADHERHELFGHPTYQRDESDILYDRLNSRTGQLLSAGTSVVFDTSFNYRKDRDRLREIAHQHGAEARTVWLNTPVEIARLRAVAEQHAVDNEYLHTMSLDDFNRLATCLEIPGSDEATIVLDGTKITPAYVADKLGIES